MKITPSLLILLVISFSSCQKKPMQDIDFETKDHKLYFLRVNEHSNQLKENIFVRQHSNFYILNMHNYIATAWRHLNRKI